MRSRFIATVLLVATTGVIVGCQKSSSKETKNSTSTSTTTQPAGNDDAEKKRLADQAAALEAERKRLEEEKAKIQAELDKAKANGPANASATNHCGTIIRSNEGGSYLACREYAGYDQTNLARMQQQCMGVVANTGYPTGGNMNWDQLIQILQQQRNNQGGQQGTNGTWGNGGCPRTIQDVNAVGKCKFLGGTTWTSAYWDVYYAPWTSANGKADCEKRSGNYGWSGP